jgi:threonine dehydrogenase-like Zn-dependent dehydrogenase
MERGALEGLLAAYRETTLVQHAPLFSEHTERAARAIDTVVGTAGAVKGGTAKGRILLVGAGPGDPGLLTVAAAKAIAAADVVLADRLVPTSILQLANGTVQVICGPHRSPVLSNLHLFQVVVWPRLT